MSRTLYEIFAPIGAIKDKYKAYVDIGSSLIKSSQHCLVLATYPNVEQKIIQTLQNHMSPLNVALVQPLISTIVHKRLPHLIYNPQHKRSKVSYTWTKMFIKSHLNWSYIAPTTTTSKLPLDWKSKSKTMALRVTFLVKWHNIPKSLMVNYNQTKVHPILKGAQGHWKKRCKTCICSKNKGQKTSHKISVFCYLTINVFFPNHLY